MVTSAARPSAPSAAAENEVAIEKKTTVPPSRVDRMAPCSHPGTSTHTTVTSAGPPAPPPPPHTAAPAPPAGPPTPPPPPPPPARRAAPPAPRRPRSRGPAPDGAAGPVPAARRQRQRTGLSGRAHHDHSRALPAVAPYPLPHHPGGQRGRPAHVHHRQRQLRGQ